MSPTWSNNILCVTSCLRDIQIVNQYLRIKEVLLSRKSRKYWPETDDEYVHFQFQVDFVF